MSSHSGRGQLITLEGIEGVGKSTQVSTVTAWLEAQGLTALATREPGGTARAERIREVLLDTEGDELPPLAELLLMFAARQTHISNLILPALRRGEWVVCDRFTDATRAYQGAGRGLDDVPIETLASWVHGEELRAPDCTVLLDAPVDVALARVRTRRGRTDRFEQEAAPFFARVRDRYLVLAEQEPDRFLVIDAAQGGPDAVAARIREALTARYSAQLVHGDG
ncbi:MAG: dTMP kinase [Pseudomonadota bacterium]